MKSTKTNECKNGVNETTKTARAKENEREKHVTYK